MSDETNNMNCLDFDECMDEIEQTELPLPTFKYKGQIYILPREVPALVMLKTLRLSKGNITDELALTELISMLEVLLDKVQTQKLLESGPSITTLGNILKQVLQSYRKNVNTPPITTMEQTAGA